MLVGKLRVQYVPHIIVKMHCGIAYIYISCNPVRGAIIVREGSDNMTPLRSFLLNILHLYDPFLLVVSLNLIGCVLAYF